MKTLIRLIDIVVRCSLIMYYHGLCYVPVERYSLSSSSSSTLTSRSLCCLRTGKFFPQCTEKVNTHGSSLKMKAVPSPCWTQNTEVHWREEVVLIGRNKDKCCTYHPYNILRSRDMLKLPDARLDPLSEPFFRARRRSGIWLQPPSHWGDRSLNQSSGRRDGFLPLCCRPDPCAEPPQQREESHLSTREKVSSSRSHPAVKPSPDFRLSPHPFHTDSASPGLCSRGTPSSFVPAHLFCR